MLEIAKVIFFSWKCINMPTENFKNKPLEDGDKSWGAAGPTRGWPPLGSADTPPQRLWPTASWGRLLAVALTPNPPAFSNYKYQGFGCGPLHPFSLHFITSIFTLQATLSHLCYFQPTTSRNLTKKSPIQASYPLVQALHHEKVRQNSFGGV